MFKNGNPKRESKRINLVDATQRYIFLHYNELKNRTFRRLHHARLQPSVSLKLLSFQPYFAEQTVRNREIDRNRNRASSISRDDQLKMSAYPEIIADIEDILQLTRIKNSDSQV